MARQAEAERERRAKVINAQGELQASETLAEAARTLASEPSALQLRYLQTVDRDRGRAQLHDDLPDPDRALPPVHPGGRDGRGDAYAPPIKVEGSAALPPQLQNVLTPGEGEAGGGGSATAANAMRGQLVRAPHYFT